MKKLLAIAAIAAMSVTAQAQQVSVYGVVDTSVQSYKNGSERLTRMADSQYSTSRFGLRGTEDLGGGLNAFFQLEGALNVAGGSVGSTSTVVANEIFNRDAYVGIGSNSFGSVRLGRTDVALVGEMDIFVTQAGNFGMHPVNGTTVELGTDQKNVIRYDSPVIKGFQVVAGRATNNVGATTDANTTQNGVAIRYQNGPIKAGLGYQKNDGAGFAKKDTTTAGVAYDFNVASVGVAYARGDNSTTADVTSSSTVASVRVPLSASYAAHAVYAQTENGASASNNKGHGYTLALTNALSKRTTLYAAYSKVNNQANSSMAMFNATSAPTAAGIDTQSFGLGINHSF